MSRKQKSTILYSRNGIKIERIDYLDMSKFDNIKCANMCFKKTIVNAIDNDEKIIKGTPKWDEQIKHESPLGFYYYTTVHHSETKDKIIKKYATYIKYVASYDNKRFEFTYPISCGDININRETRPWDILPGYKGIPDHFITDLYKEVIKFFDICEDERIRYQISPAHYGYYKTDAVYAKDMSWINDEKKQVMIDLFGDENGPSVNYNDINILRHGFDLKQSFRKRKES